MDKNTVRRCFAYYREDWLSQLITELDDTNSYEYLKHLTDMHRLHLFDIVMQYRAVFFEGSAAQVRQVLCSLHPIKLVVLSLTS